MTRYKVITSPSELGVSLDELKTSLQIEHNEKDVLLTSILETAIDYCETKLGWYLASRSVEMVRDDIPRDGIVNITRGPVASSGFAIAYIAAGATTYTDVPSTNYQLDNVERIARILFTEIPAYSTEALNAIRFSYIAGYPDVALVPAKVRKAVILVASELYLNPENASMNFGMGIKYTAADNLLHSEINDHVDD